MSGHFPRCYACGIIGQVRYVHYTSKDGVHGVTYGMCMSCCENEEPRLKREGFVNIFYHWRSVRPT